METTFKLSKEEIADGIIQAIGIKQNMIFMPFRIISMNKEIPDGVEIKIEFVPRGSKTSDYPHILEVENENKS